ncbi:hypothetical protein EJB05_45079, partial [Eragrostis curvula]
MKTGIQSESAIALFNTTTTPGPGNGEIEVSITHGDSNGIGDSGNESSSRALVDNSTNDEFDLLWRLRKYLILIGILAVSVTYSSGLSPPGGSWNKNQDGHEAGDPALRIEFFQRYEVFFYCNATAFAASLVLIILLLSKSVTRQSLWLRSMQFTMILDLFSLLGAYAAGSCRALKSSIYTWVLVFGVFLYVGIHTLVSTRIVPQTLKEKVKKAVTRILSKFGEGDGQTSSLEEKKDLEQGRKFILMLVTFAASVTYDAGLHPPGGFWAENEYLSGFAPPYKHRPATSILRSHYLRRYNIFVICNSTSFVASLVTMILLLSPELSAHGIRSKAVVFCVVADLLFLIGAYAAGCCRDVATSFYVIFIVVIVLICIVLLSGIFVYKPTAKLIEKIKSETKCCMDGLGRVLSLKFSRSRSRIPEESTHAGHQQDSVHVTSEPVEDNASESEQQAAGNQQVSNATERGSGGENPPADNQITERVKYIEEAWSNSRHPSGNSLQSTGIMDSMPNLEHHSTDCQLVANTTLSCQETSNSRTGLSADSQQAVGVMEQSSTDDTRTIDTAMEVFSERNISAGVDSGDTNNSIEQHISVGNNNGDIEIGDVHNDAQHPENGNIGSNQVAQDQEPLEKTRTNVLLLAILAVSLTYQSGLNPPGGFWSKNAYNHSAGDRILEDNNHARFLAFYYLNAVAFVASIVIILILLDKSSSKKVTKYRVLQIFMIVDLLSLTGAFAMGSCRDAKKSIYIWVLVCIVLAYVALHVRIVIYIIPSECKTWVADKLRHFSCGNVWSALCHRQMENSTETKELERRRNLLLTLSILAATVTYQAGIYPPGDVWSDDEGISGKPGNPVLQDSHRKRYDVFYYSNSLSFVSSVVITILLVNKESCDNGIKSYALRVCLMMGLLGLLIAYAAGSCRNLRQSIFLIAIAVAVLISLVIQVLLSSMHDTIRRPLAQLMGYLQKLVDFLQRHVFRTVVRRETTSEPSEISNCIEKNVRKRHKYLMFIATLAASVTYQAGLNPPGGLWSDDDKGHLDGDPILHDINHRRYMTFFCFNAISFMISIIVIMLLLSKSVRKKDGLLEVLLWITVIDLLSLITAFAAGSCRKLSTSFYIFLLVAGVVIYLVLFIVLSRAIAKYLISNSRHPEPVSRTVTPVQGEQP